MSRTANTQRNLPPVMVLEQDYEQLVDLICASPRATPGITLLWQELQRATVLPSTYAPDELARVDSRIHFHDLDRRETRMVRLVYPDEAASPNLEPVTSSIGAALLGLRPGDTFQWCGADGLIRTVQIHQVEPPTRPRRRRSQSSH